MVDIGTLRQSATLWTPGTPVSDGDGGFTTPYTLLDPSAWRCAIAPATASVAQRHFAATVIAQASYLLTGRFHSGIRPGTRIIWVDRADVTHTGDVVGVEDVEGAGVVTMALVSEVVGAAPPPDSTSWIQSEWAQ